MSDDNVIYAEFGNEREWKLTRERTESGLIAVGAVFGDSEQLMKAKAEIVYQLLRAIINDVPNVKMTFRLPEDLSTETVDLVHEGITAAALKGVEIALAHSVSCLMENIYDLCTSKLR